MEKQPRGNINVEVAEQQYEADIVIVILALIKKGFESHRENAIRRAKDEAVHIEQKDIQGR